MVDDSEANPGLRSHVHAGFGEFSAVGFNYGGVDASGSTAKGPVDDLGEEGSSDDSGKQARLLVQV